MPVRMIELEEVTMVETTDKALEAMVAEVRGVASFGFTGPPFCPNQI